MLIQFIAFVVLFLLIAAAASAQIPHGAEKYRREMIRNERLYWGLDAPIAMLAGQLEQESAWRPDAKSSAGAVGLAQFMPSTATWLSGAYEALGPAEPQNPAWALRAHAQYTKHLWDRMNAADQCSRGAKMLASYNSGEGHLRQDEAVCRKQNVCPLSEEPVEDSKVAAALRLVWERSFGKEPPEPQSSGIYCGCDEAVWWDNLERINAPGRSQANWNQSRTYARRILRVLEPHYATAGWGRGVCTL